MAATIRLKNISELLKESKPFDEDTLIRNIRSKFVKNVSVVNQVYFKQDKVRHRQNFAALQEGLTEDPLNF